MHRVKKLCLPFIVLLPTAIAIMLAFQSLVPRDYAMASSKNSQAALQVYLPLLVRLDTNTIPTPLPSPSPTSKLRRINAPLFDDNIAYSWTALFWLGHVNPLEDYADVRVGYNNQELYVSFNIIDRRLWYNPKPTTSPLTSWDSASLYLSRDGNTGGALNTNTYRFDGQLSWWESRANYQAAYRGSDTGWVRTSIPFTTTTGWRGDAPDDNTDDNGWRIDYEIPFASLGLAGPPTQDSKWGLAAAVHNRDYLESLPMADETWPETMSGTVPSTWGQLNFGLPTYTTPRATPRETVIIRQGLNGAVVPDVAAGGTLDNLCGQSQGTWDTWGNANFAGAPRFNIQNQSDIADWMCFSKYYVTFPLDAIPLGKAVISATLSLHEFGNSGQPSSAYPSLIQVMTIGQDWNESTLTWNNAPFPNENVSQGVIDPVTSFPGWPGVPWNWDVSGAVAQAHAAGTPLRLVLYEADSAYNSGKYFLGSDEPDWDAVGRPALTVLWGNP